MKLKNLIGGKMSEIDKNFNYTQQLLLGDYAISQSVANDKEVGRYNGVTIYKCVNEETGEYKEVLHLNYGVEIIKPLSFDELKERLEGHIVNAIVKTQIKNNKGD